MWYRVCTLRRAASRLPLLLLTALLPVALLLPGCAWLNGGADTRTVAATGHNPVSLSCYRAGRVYSAQGRYELAKEQYLLAYAAAEGDTDLRADLEQELRAVDMMLRTLR